MVKSELIKKSPLRILEKSTHGGVGKGNIGVLSSREGVGKTACLVHIATDKLFQGKHIIHVSFAGKTDHIISWYEDIFQELSRRLNLENAMEIHDEIIRNRVIMNFDQRGVSIVQIVKSLHAMIEQGAFAADCIIVDGFDFKLGTPEDLHVFRGAAEKLGVELWFSSSLKDKDLVFDADGIPELLVPFLDEIAILIFLRPEQGVIRLELKKDHQHKPADDLHLILDPKILLIAGDK